MASNKTLVRLYLYVVVICSLSFFVFRIGGDILTNLALFVVLVAVLLSIPFMFIESRGIVLLVHVICASIFLSIFMARISWGQEYFDSVKATIPYLVWFFFFYLLHEKVQIPVLEKVVVFYGGLYIIFFLFQSLNSQTVYFGFRDEFLEDRGVTRIVFPGAGVFYLAIFIALTKFTEKARNKWLWLGLIVIGFVVTILQVTRQTIAAILLVYLFHFVKDMSLKRKIAVVALVAVSVVLLFSTNLKIVKGMKDITLKNKGEGLTTKNIRWRAADYFLNKFSPEVYNRILGNGVPNTQSGYGVVEKNLKLKYGYYFSDVGIISFYIFFGIFAEIAYIILISRCLFAKIPEKYLYLKYYIFFLIVTGLISDSVLSFNYLIINVFVFYMFHLIYIQSKEGGKKERKKPVLI